MLTKRLLHVLAPALLLWWLAACNNNQSTTAETNSNETVEQHKENGRWLLDRVTAEELRGMGMTIDNFTLLNKKKFENSGAYQEYGLLLENHMKRIDTYCQLGADCKADLYVRLDSIKNELPVLSKGDLEEGKAAVLRVRSIWSGVDSTFNYGY